MNWTHIFWTGLSYYILTRASIRQQNFIHQTILAVLNSVCQQHLYQGSLAKLNNSSLKGVCRGRWGGKGYKLNVLFFCLFLMADICLHCFFCTRAHINSKPQPQYALSAIFLFFPPWIHSS